VEVHKTVAPKPTRTFPSTHVSFYPWESTPAGLVERRVAAVILAQRSGDADLDFATFTAAAPSTVTSSSSTTAEPAVNVGGSSRGLSTGALAGIIVASILGPLLLAAALGFWIMRRRRRRREEEGQVVGLMMDGKSEEGGGGGSETDGFGSKPELDASLATLPPVEMAAAGHMGRQGVVEMGDMEVYELSEVNNEKEEKRGSGEIDVRPVRQFGNGVSTGSIN